MATDGRALYRLVVVSADQRDSTVTVSRLPVKGAPWRVSVVERLAPEADETIPPDADRYWLRQRKWSFNLDGIESVTLETEQRLEDPELRPLEQFARTLADAAGWDVLTATGEA